MKQTKQRGGARPGSGRKDPVTKRRVNFTIAIELADKLKLEPNQSATVEEALKKHYEKNSIIALQLTQLQMIRSPGS